MHYNQQNFFLADPPLKNINKKRFTVHKLKDY